MAVYVFGARPVKGAFHIPLMRIGFMPCKLDLGAYDGFVCTSINAIEALVVCDRAVLQKSFIVIGNSSANRLKTLGASQVHRPTRPNALHLANEFGTQIKNKRFLYVHGKDLTLDLQTFWAKQGIGIDAFCAYKAHLIEPTYEQVKQVAQGSWVILGSDRIIGQFCKYWTVDNHKVMLLAQKSLQELQRIKPFVSSMPSYEVALADIKKLELVV